MRRSRALWGVPRIKLFCVVWVFCGCRSRVRVVVFSSSVPPSYIHTCAGLGLFYFEEGMERGAEEKGKGMCVFCVFYL